MGCRFCAVDDRRAERNLTPEINRTQILAAQRRQVSGSSHVVVMNREPFDNYENLSKFIRIINDTMD